MTSIFFVKFLTCLLAIMALYCKFVAAQTVVPFNDKAQMRAYSYPGTSARYGISAVIISNNRPTFYIYHDTCPGPYDDSLYIKPDSTSPSHKNRIGCWRLATSAYLTAGPGLMRVGDQFLVDSGYVSSMFVSMSMLDSFYTKNSSDSRYVHWTDTVPSGGIMTKASAEQSIAMIESDINTRAQKSTQLTINGVTQDLSTNHTWTIPGIDTSSISSRINTKLSVSDTTGKWKPVSYSPSSSEIVSGLGYVPYNSTNPNNYINSTAIAGKLNTSDTSIMLSPYLRKNDTTSLSNRVNTKLSITDTTGKWKSGSYTPSSSEINTALGYTPYNGTTNPNNFLTTSSIAGKLNTSDTTAMLVPYLKKSDTTSLLSKSQAASLYQPSGSYTTTTQLNNKLNISDTVNMLSVYLRKNDTTSLSNRINNKLNTSDTSALLSKSQASSVYQPAGSYATTNQLNTKLNSSDTGSLSNRINSKLNTSDTSTLLFKTQAAATYQPLGTYATTSQLNNKVSYTDTAAMLSPYLKKSDTTSLLSKSQAAVTYQPIGSYATTSQIAAKVNYTDTSSMLAPYFRKGDTTSMSNRINTKLNISDTTGKWLPASYTGSFSTYNKAGTLLAQNAKLVTDTFAVASATPTITWTLPSGTTTSRIVGVTGYKLSGTAANSPQVSVSAYTNTSVSVVITQQNTTTVTILGIPVLSGSPLILVTDYTGVRIIVSYIVY